MIMLFAFEHGVALEAPELRAQEFAILVSHDAATAQNDFAVHGLFNEFWSWHAVDDLYYLSTAVRTLPRFAFNGYRFIFSHNSSSFDKALLIQSMASVTSVSYSGRSSCHGQLAFEATVSI